MTAYINDLRLVFDFSQDWVDQIYIGPINTRSAVAAAQANQLADLIDTGEPINNY